MVLKFAGYILGKVLTGILTLVMLSFVVFYTTTFFSPLQRASMYLSDQRYIYGPDPVGSLVKKYGLDDPFHVQYLRWLQGIVLNHNFGWSNAYYLPVISVVSSAFPATIELVMYAAPVGIIGGYKVGSYLAKRASSKTPHEDLIDFAAKSLTVIVYSIPSFVLGLLLLMLWSYFGQLPVGRLSLNVEHYVYSSSYTRYTGLHTIDALLNGQLWVFVDAALHLILPVATLAAAKFAIVVRITRSSMIKESSKNYIIAAKAKGLDEKGVVKHAKKNSMISVFTVSGTLLAGMLTGVVVTEYIFNLGGIGNVVMVAAQRLDYALLVFLALLFCTIFMVINLLVDMAYAYVDPRVRV